MKTLEIYDTTLYPTIRRFGIDQLVEDNSSPHNKNDRIRAIHQRQNIRIVRYDVTDVEKRRFGSESGAQMMKQTCEIERLPSWTPNYTDLNIIESVWSCDHEWSGGSTTVMKVGVWLSQPEEEIKENIL